MIEIPSISPHLILNDEGIWTSSERGTISYPEEGNELLFSLEDNSYWFNHRNNCICETVKNFPPPDNTIIDIGSGNGFISNALNKIGIETICVEPGFQGIQNAKARGLKNLIWTDFKKGLFLRESIPAVGFFDVLEHLSNEKDLFLSLHECLRKNGRIYLTVPAYTFLWSNEDVFAGHFRRYSQKRLSNIAISCGFIVEYITCMFSFLPLPIFLLRTLPSLIKHKSGIHKNSDYSSRKGLSGFIMDKFLNCELKAIRKQSNTSIGSSILAVLRKGAG